jgi:outer membrane protein assembly factor BamB
MDRASPSRWPREATVRIVAGGRAFGRFEAALGIIGIAALTTTVFITTGWDPVTTLRLNELWAWISTPSSLSTPPTAWTKRVGGRPSGAAVAVDVVVVSMRGVVEARDLHTGEVRWTRDGDWGAVAGEGATAVAVVGKASGHGFDVLDPATATTRWSDSAAIGTWTYREMILSLTCPGLSDCSLAARAPLDGAIRWKTTLPGIGRSLAGVNRPLLGTRELASSYVDALANSPRPVPKLLGFPLNARVQVVDTASGKRLREEKPSDTTRVVVVGGRIVASTAVQRDGACRFTLEGREANSGRTLWKRDGYDVHTASGAGCEQSRDPGGSDNVLVATRGDNRDVFLSIVDGSELWVGAPGELILATDGRYGLVRTADRTAIKEIDLSGGGTVWTRPATSNTTAAITRYAVFITDPSAGRLLALEPGSNRTLIDVKTSATLLGYSSTGVVLHISRTVGFLPYGTIG